MKPLYGDTEIKINRAVPNEKSDRSEIIKKIPIKKKD
jgi:hypothetical protein